MKAIVDKLIIQEKEMANEKGQFHLFALFLREDAPDKWDLLVAASWINKDKVAALKYVASKVQTCLKRDELVKLSRIVIIDDDNPALGAIQRTVHIEHGVVEIKNSSFFGLNIRHAYLITSIKDKKN